ncbi:MAG: 2-polyprenyl-3-methyl-6-methoxy-1,4-benzoquinone monooxygenase [Pigmentiphaga sp.]
MTTPTPSSLRRTNRLDSFLAEANRALQVLTGVAQASRPNPADAAAASQTAAEELSPAERAHAARLMRVNHVGEICAQALYRGQATLARDEATRRVFDKAAQEEVDHLAWLNQRLRELNGRPSLLNPLWYAGSFTLGVLAARAGTPYNLGFMAETERQVGEHLASHLQKLPANDQRSRDIVEQMRLDEVGHQRQAEQAGGRQLPAPARAVMRGMSKMMTTTAHWI